MKLIQASITFGLLAVASGLRGCANDHVQEAENTDISAVETKKKVQVGVFVESLCPGCKEEIAEEVAPAYDLLQNIVDLTVVPYGNAMIDMDAKELDCQHGEGECIANSYMQCAKDIYPFPSRYFPFIKCIMGQSDADNVLEPLLYRDCAHYAALDFAAIEECRGDDDRVWDLQVQASKETPADHEYVPWLTINGKHFDQQDGMGLVEAICNAYNNMAAVFGEKPYAACPERNEEVFTAM